jgi:ParB family protein of integrating conjugative element (PFGI_1 class)
MGINQDCTKDIAFEMPGATNNETREIHPADPLTKSPIRVTLNQLRPYDKNPRTSRNPKFDEILISIENTGLNHPPNITRRSPDDPQYMIIDGGNTRLVILRILYAKYTELAYQAENENIRQKHLKKAESFYVINCIFKPWERESKALMGHMIENENRGHMLFIEKALAVQTLRELYEEEDRTRAKQEGLKYDNKPLSGRMLAKRSTRDGWPISQSHISRYDYAVNTLLDGISQAFWAGAGEPLVRQLRKYEKAYTRFWEETDRGNRNTCYIKTLFIDSLREHDGETVDIPGFLKTINEHLGDVLELDPSTVAAEVEAFISGSVSIPPSLHHEGISLRNGNIAQQEEKNEAGDLSNKRASQRADQENPKRPKAPANRLSDLDQHNETMSIWAGHSFGSESLLSMILDSVKRLGSRYGFTIEESSQEQRNNGRINAFFIAPTGRAFRPSEEDEPAAVWWALSKISGTGHDDTNNQNQGFESILRKQYRIYIEDQQRGLLGTIIFLENFIIVNPDNSAMREELFEIQRLCGRYVQHITTLRGLKKGMQELSRHGKK